MTVYLVERPSDTVLVSIFRNKSDNTFSFINLTKQHICPCRFISIEDALSDMDKQVSQGKIIKYYPLN